MAIWSQSVEGLDKLLKDFAKLPDECINALIPASIRGGKAIQELAKSRVPTSKSGKGYYDMRGNSGKLEWNHPPGHLKKSIELTKPTRGRDRKRTVTTTVGFGKGAAYGVPLELGHKLVFFGTPTGTYVKERPFLRSSADDKKQYVIDEHIRALNAALDAFGRKG